MRKLFFVFILLFFSLSYPQFRDWKNIGISKGVPLPLAENFKPRFHGDECIKAGLKKEILEKIDIVMQRHVAAKNVASISAMLSSLTPSSAQPIIPYGVKVFRDIPYVSNGHERQKLDLYLPENSNEPLPVIIWIHGGGWQSGSKENCLPLRKGFVNRGYAIASINYRLSSHATFPAQIEDCKSAIRWLRAHAKEYGLDVSRFGIWRSSAGGHLAALIGTTGDVKEFDGGENLDQSSRV